MLLHITSRENHRHIFFHHFFLWLPIFKHDNDTIDDKIRNIVGFCLSPSVVLRWQLSKFCAAASSGAGSAMLRCNCYAFCVLLWRQCNDATTSIMVYIDNYWFWLLSPLYPSYWPLFLFSIRLVSQKINGRTFWFLLRERMEYCWGIFRNNQNILLRRGCQDHIFLVWRHLKSQLFQHTWPKCIKHQMMCTVQF